MMYILALILLMPVLSSSMSGEEGATPPPSPQRLFSAPTSGPNLSPRSPLLDRNGREGIFQFPPPKPQGDRPHSALRHETHLPIAQDEKPQSQSTPTSKEPSAPAVLSAQPPVQRVNTHMDFDVTCFGTPQTPVSPIDTRPYAADFPGQGFIPPSASK